jgi:ATP-binding cassette subfamily B protein
MTSRQPRRATPMLKTLKLLAGGLKNFRKLMLMHVIHVILIGLPVFYLFFAIAELMKPAPERSPGKLIFCFLMVAATMISNVFLAVRVYVGDYITSVNLSTQARLRLADHLRRLSLGFFKKKDPGEISSLMLQDMSKVETLFSHLLVETVSFSILPALMALFFLSQDWRLALLMLAAFAAALPALLVGQRVIGRYGEKQIGSRNRAASRILEYLQGINVLKAFSMTGKSFARLDGTLKTLKKDCLMLEAASGVPIVVYSVILEVGLALLIMLSARLLFVGSVTPVTFVLFMIVGIRFFEPLLNLALFASEFRYMHIAAGRITDALSEKPLPEGTPEKLKGCEIVFRDVTFGYDRERPVIRGFSHVFPERSMTALVGPSGGGKTTLTSLMARFWDPDSGSVSIGGVDIRNIPADSLNAMFTFVFQDVYFFQDTVYENIRVGDREATEERIHAAAKLAQCHDLILGLEDGYLTRVGEGGASLSGGERQRVSIARAILKDAPIVVLDEATASMDPENELGIQSAIGALVRDKTLIVIAHRLRTVAKADAIVVVDGGRIRESGTHGELLERGDLYARLWSEQRKTGGWKFAKKAADG